MTTDLMLEEEEGGTAHSSRGPSSAHRWINCNGSINLIQKLGDKAAKSGILADEGSAAHQLLAHCLLNREMAWEHEGEVINYNGHDFPVDKAMVDGVQMAIDWVAHKMEQFADKHPILIVEQRVGDPANNEDAWGTTDIGIIIPRERIIVADFKYGKGVVVEPDDEQTRSYGHYGFTTFETFNDLAQHGGAFDLTQWAPGDAVFEDPNTLCELYILQPRIPHPNTKLHPEGLIRRHVTNRSELARWAYGEMLPAMAESQKPDAPLAVGDWCGWCPARDYCPALRRGADEIEIGIEPIALDNEALGALLVKAKAIVKYLNGLEAEAFKRVMAGQKVPGKKLVHKIGNRIWKEGAEAALFAKLGQDIYTKPELKGPPGIEELRGGKALATRWAMKPQTGLTIADVSDKRSEVTSHMDEFDKQNGVTEGATPPAEQTP